jgi:hypothetical protein
MGSYSFSNYSCWFDSLLDCICVELKLGEYARLFLILWRVVVYGLGFHAVCLMFKGLGETGTYSFIDGI